MEVIAFANQKGGVAKTTSTYNIAALKALSGKRVLIIDLDPQASLTILCGFMPGKSEFSTCNLFDGKSDPLDCGYLVKSINSPEFTQPKQLSHTANQQGQQSLNLISANLYIVPSDIELAEVEQRIISKTAREKILSKSMRAFENYFDYVFIDCPPQLGILTTNALVAADKVIVPTKAEYLSYRGIRALRHTIQNIIDEGLNEKLTLEGFIITMFEKNINDQRDMLEQFKKEASVLGIVKKSADTYRSILEGLPVVISQAKSDVSIAYKEVTEKIS